MGSQVSWHPVQSFCLPSIVVSLFGSLDSFAVCICAVHVCCVCVHMCAVHVCVCTYMYVHGFSRRHFPKSFYQQSNQPNFQRDIFLEVRPWCLCNLFPLPRQEETEDCFRLAAAEQGVEMGNICLVFNVWYL